MTNLILDRKNFVESLPTTKSTLSAIKTVDLNVTELCNRTCPFCPRYSADVYPNRKLHMSLDNAFVLGQRLADINYNNEIQIGGQGEPLLHPNIVDIVQILRQSLPKNLNLHLTTNADRLDTNLLEKLTQAGLNRIYVSLYDSSEQFQKLKNQLGNNSIEVIYKHFYLPKEMSWGLPHISNRAGLLPSDNGVPQQRCHLPFYSMSVDWDTSVTLCVHDWNKKFIAGYLNKNSIEEIWLGPKMNDYRKMLINERRILQPCNTCNVDGRFYGQSSFDLFKEKIDG